jgi:hypothetical protein
MGTMGTMGTLGTLLPRVVGHRGVRACGGGGRAVGEGKGGRGRGRGRNGLGSMDGRRVGKEDRGGRSGRSSSSSNTSRVVEGKVVWAGAVRSWERT